MSQMGQKCSKCDTFIFECDILYTQSKMNKETIELDEDKITEALNKRLEDDAKQEKLDEEVEKRLTKHKEETAKRKKAEEVHEATFKDETDNKKKKIAQKTKIECWNCEGNDLEKISEDGDILMYMGQKVDEVWRCNDCGKRTGVEL